MRMLLVAAAAAALAGCTSGGGSSGTTDSNFLSGNRDSGGTVPIPSDTRRFEREGTQRPTMEPPETQAQIAARHARSVAAADALWSRACAIETSNPGGAAELFRDLAEGHPESPRAAEAKFREGRARYRAHDYREAIDALKRYMEVAPTNPHLAEVEELIYRSGVQYLRTLTGLNAIFRTKATGYEALSYVAETFPNGAFADDALLALGEAHRTEQDQEGWVRSVLAYKLLLLRYPDSPLATKARLGLATSYMARDQGTRYNGGYTVLDPREDLPAEMEQAALQGPVVSGPELALEQYEAILDEGRATPAEYSAAQCGAAAARQRIAAKDERTANWYARRGATVAAQKYRQSAAEVRNPNLVAPVAPAPAAPTKATPPSATPPGAGAPTPPPVAPPAAVPQPPSPPPPTPTPPAPPTLPGGGTPTTTSAPPGTSSTLPPPASRRLPGATSGSK